MQVKNLAILLLAPVMAFGLFYVTRDFSGLTASVLDVSELASIQTQWWDVAYKSTDQIFEVFGSEKVKKADAISLQILYDPERLMLDEQSISGVSVVSSQSTSWLLEVVLQGLVQLPVQESWFSVAFLGESRDILLAEGYASNKLDSRALSIGNLNSNPNENIE